MEITSETLKRMSEHRPAWPKRAVVTSGMPYGNKSLHCGHITLFIHSDFFARFLRDRIGSENVYDEIKEYTLITCDYNNMGTIGIIGPRRMDYKKVISYLKYIIN